MIIYYLKRDKTGKMNILSGVKHGQVGNIVVIDISGEFVKRAEDFVFTTRIDAQIHLDEFPDVSVV